MEITFAWKWTGLLKEHRYASVVKEGKQPVSLFFKIKSSAEFIFLNPSQGVVTNFEIFRMREKQVPVDVVEMKGKNRINIQSNGDCFPEKNKSLIYILFLSFQKA